MITIDMGTLEYYDEEQSQFIYEDGGVVRFEYSLKAMYDWESKWRKPFFKGEHTEEESLDFYMTMALDPVDIKFMSSSIIEQLKNYIEDSHTATTFSSHESSGGQSKFVKPKAHTAEELYAMMFSASVPLEFENRNLNRLMTILKIISTHSEPPKKMSKQDILRQNSELNRKRRAEMKTKG